MFYKSLLVLFILVIALSILQFTVSNDPFGMIALQVGMIALWVFSNIYLLTLKILLSSSTSVLPGHKAFIISNSANIHPTDHMSIAVEYS